MSGQETSAPPTWSSGQLVGLGLGGGLALALLVALGKALAGPPEGGSITKTSAWADWAAAVGPAGVVMGLVRVMALLGLGYLVVLVVIELVGRWSSASTLLDASRRLCLPGMASWLSQAAAAGLVVSALAGSVGAAGAATPPPPVVVMHQLPAAPASTSPTPPTTDAPLVSPRADPDQAPPIMQVVGPQPGHPARTPTSSTTTTSTTTTSTTTTSTTTSPTTAALAAPTPAAPADPATTWTIRPGDHLWRVARSTLAARSTPSPTDAEVLGYLHDLIDANRSRLVVPTDPDLVFPGQVFVLPPVPAAG